MSMSSAGRAENSNGCVTRPKGREIGLSGFAAQIQLYSLTGSYVMATAEHREPYESRGSRTVLGARGGEIPPRDSTFTSLWLLRSTVPMSASHPKATESLRSSEMTLSAMNGLMQCSKQSARCRGILHYTAPVVDAPVAAEREDRSIERWSGSCSSNTRHLFIRSLCRRGSRASLFPAESGGRLKLTN